jgi:hypothetical protein
MIQLIGSTLRCSECGHESTDGDPVSIQAVPAGLIGEVYVPKCVDPRACVERQNEWRKANGLRTERELVEGWYRGGG